MRPHHRIVGTIVGILFLIFSLYSWNFYLNHYSKRAIVVRSWQAGYRELAQYIQENYDKYDTFYITKENGQPYIFLLFYLGYDPATYQKQATLSPPDEYGFGQVERFDKFIFTFTKPEQGKYVLIGSPNDFKNAPELDFDENKLKKIKVGTEEIFWIQEST